MLDPKVLHDAALAAALGKVAERTYAAGRKVKQGAVLSLLSPEALAAPPVDSDVAAGDVVLVIDADNVGWRSTLADVVDRGRYSLRYVVKATGKSIVAVHMSEPDDYVGADLDAVMALKPAASEGAQERMVLKSAKRYVVRLASHEQAVAAVQSHPLAQRFVRLKQAHAPISAEYHARAEAARHAVSDAAAPMEAHADALNKALGIDVVRVFKPYVHGVGRDESDAPYYHRPYSGSGSALPADLIEDVLAGRLALGKVTVEQYALAKEALAVTFGAGVVRKH